ncbi:MAG: riboflavin synthase [Phycisphaeraceae bacterium]|nr:riboflavin synthase [Phycisphaeraceae bacterium]MBX3405718.1 riboflavin synthase [Phycisphaeraceae bacterium]
MFTGLVQAVGRVAAIEQTGRGPAVPVRLRVDPGSWRHRSALGDSICVGGVCLTIAALGRGRAGRGGRTLEFDVIPETLSRTTLGGLKAGDRVNLEHAVTAATLMGGHFVQGHVDGVGRVVSVRAGDDWRVRVRVPRELRPLMIPKGSVCVDGVSLTIAAVHADGFEVALIPTTLELTTLSRLRAGDGVNIEADMLVKSVASVLRGMGAHAKRGAARQGTVAVKRNKRSRS